MLSARAGDLIRLHKLEKHFKPPYDLAAAAHTLLSKKAVIRKAGPAFREHEVEAGSIGAG